MKSILSNKIVIDCTVSDIFDYVTQPWLWHEWHPNSISAVRKKHPLKAGDQFEEDIELSPLEPLPIKIKKHSIYDVLESKPNEKWIVEGAMSNGKIRIKYEFYALSETSTEFKRTLMFNTKGAYNLLHPILYRYLKRTSSLAIHRLKETCESKFSS